jgi:hypothetical protein
MSKRNNTDSITILRLLACPFSIEVKREVDQSCLFTYLSPISTLDSRESRFENWGAGVSIQLVSRSAYDWSILSRKSTHGPTLLLSLHNTAFIVHIIQPPQPYQFTSLWSLIHRSGLVFVFLGQLPSLALRKPPSRTPSSGPKNPHASIHLD